MISYYIAFGIGFVFASQNFLTAIDSLSDPEKFNFLESVVFDEVNESASVILEYDNEGLCIDLEFFYDRLCQIEKAKSSLLGDILEDLSVVIILNLPSHKQILGDERMIRFGVFFSQMKDVTLIRGQCLESDFNNISRWIKDQLSGLRYDSIQYSYKNSFTQGRIWRDIRKRNH